MLMNDFDMVQCDEHPYEPTQDDWVEFSLWLDMVQAESFDEANRELLEVRDFGTVFA